VEYLAFVDRVRKRIPARPPAGFHFESWPHAGRPTDEGFGLLAIPGLDPAKAIDAVMDVDHYVGNVDHVSVCRSIRDPRFVPPEAVRFYQKLDIPLLGAIHHDLVLRRMGTLDDWQVAAWDINRAETDALSAKEGFRSTTARVRGSRGRGCSATRSPRRPSATTSGSSSGRPSRRGPTPRRGGW
jgi:hypothetical protein